MGNKWKRKSWIASLCMKYSVLSIVIPELFYVALYFAVKPHEIGVLIAYG